MRNKLIIAGGIIILATCWWVAWSEIDTYTRKMVSDCPGGVSNTQEKTFKSDWDRQDRVRTIKNILSVAKAGTVGLSQQYIYDLKNELCKLTGTEKPVKIYAGKWHKDCLEVIKCLQPK